MKVRVLCWIEMDIPPVAQGWGEQEHRDFQVTKKLDNFRESVLPSDEYGLTIYQADRVENLEV